MPKALPLALALFVYWLMDKRGVSALRMMAYLIFGGIVLGYLGIV